MATFFQAWRKRQADQQAAEWLLERDEARRAVEGAPAAIRHDVRRVMETLMEGEDEEVEGALDELEQLLEPYPDLRADFFRLRIVHDAKASLSLAPGES
jgi:hypothetical protein